MVAALVTPALHFLLQMSLLAASMIPVFLQVMATTTAVGEAVTTQCSDSAIHSPGSALLELGFENVQYAQIQIGELRQLNEPRRVRLFTRNDTLQRFIADVTRKFRSGELWESQTETMFRYWELNRTLESEANIRLGSGWVNRSESYGEFLNRNQCHHVLGRYAMVTPILQPAAHDFLVKLTGSTPRATLFAGCNGTSTALHFDSSRNFFIQLRGKKRFVFLPPSHLQKIYLAPTGHPYHRHSLIEPGNLTGVDRRKYPRFSNMNHSVFVADLEPGELVLVPEFWAHYVVTTSDDSLGLAVRWPFDDFAETVLRKLPIPFNFDWSFSEKVVAMRLYLDQLIPLTAVDRRLMYKDRWVFAFEGWKGRSNSSVKNIIDDDAAFSEQHLAKFAQYSDRVLATLGELVLNSDIREQLLLDYCDDMLLTLFRPQEAIGFMLHMYPIGATDIAQSPEE